MDMTVCRVCVPPGPVTAWGDGEAVGGAGAGTVDGEDDTGILPGVGDEHLFLDDVDEGSLPDDDDDVGGEA